MMHDWMWTLLAEAAPYLTASLIAAAMLLVPSGLARVKHVARGGAQRASAARAGAVLGLGNE